MSFLMRRDYKLISQKASMTSFCKSQCPHKSVNLSFIIATLKNKLTGLCGNRLLLNDFVNAVCEIKARRQALTREACLALTG